MFNRRLWKSWKSLNEVRDSPTSLAFWLLALLSPRPRCWLPLPCEEWLFTYSSMVALQVKSPYSLWCTLHRRATSLSSYSPAGAYGMHS
jgi:hypothetical protein